jgi:hypothetical protein
VPLAKDGILNQDIVSFNRAGAGMVEVTPGVWEWGPHNLSPRGMWGDDGTGLYKEDTGNIRRIHWTNAPQIWGCIVSNSSGQQFRQGMTSTFTVRHRASAGFPYTIYHYEGGGTYIGTKLDFVGDEQWRTSTITITQQQADLLDHNASFSRNEAVWAGSGWVEFDMDSIGTCYGDSAELITLPALPQGASPYFAPRMGTDANGERFTLLNWQSTNLWWGSETYDPAASVNGITFTTTGIYPAGKGLVVRKVSYSGTLTAAWASCSIGPVFGLGSGTTRTCSALARASASSTGFPAVGVYATTQDWSSGAAVGRILLSDELARMMVTDTDTTHAHYNIEIQVGGTLGDTISGDVFYFGVQIENGDIATSPIPTWGAQVARAADLVTVPNTGSALIDNTNWAVLVRGSQGYSRSGPAFWLTNGSNDREYVSEQSYGIGSWDAVSAITAYLLSGSQADGTVRTFLTSGSGSATTAMYGGAGELESVRGGWAAGGGDNSFLRIGGNGGGGRFLDGKLYQLYTIPSQPDATTRAKLAALWS